MTPLRAGLLAWMESIIGQGEVLWADGNGPILQRPYVTMKVSNVRREGSPTYFPLNESGGQPILQGALLTLSVSAYAHDLALDMAVALSGSLNRSTVLALLRLHGLAFVDIVMPPTDTSVVVGTTFESRATFDARFRANIGDIDPVGWIETVILNGRIEAGGRIIETSQTIGVN